MSGPSFDFNNNDFIFHTSDHTGIGSNGNVYVRTGDNMAVDLNSGEIHVTSDWTDKKSVDVSRNVDQQYYIVDSSGGGDWVVAAAVIFAIALILAPIAVIFLFL